MPSRPAAPPSQEFVRLLLAQSEDYALFFTTPEGTITDWYPGAQRIFGFSPEEMVGRSFSRLFNDEDVQRGAPEHEMEVARAGRCSEDDRWHVRKDGSRFWASGVLLALRDRDSQLIGYAKIARNRTDLKTQTESLENRVAVLEAALERMRIFLGTVGHEMRNPLTPLLNATQLLRIEQPDSEALRIIDRQVALLGRLVDDLMDTTRISVGKVQLNLDVVDLSQIFHATAQAVRQQAEARGLEFHMLAISGPVPVYADAQRMQQVFANLLDNALKYTPSGGKIIFNLLTEGGDAVVRVEDTGIGISGDVLPHIFDIFTQEEGSRKHARGGLGLGLSLVHDLIQLHSGTVQARSDGRDKGSIFTVRLPIHQATQP